MTKPYRIRHKASGLYYQPAINHSNLSKKGKVYMTNNSLLMINNSYDYIAISVRKGTKIHDILEKEMPLKGVEVFYGTAVLYRVPKSEFEKEELQLMKIEDIKFKAKSILDGSWVQGDLIHKEDGKIAILRNEFNVSEVDPSTVCLFTGEKDMNGDNIYVGDIISNLETKSVIEVVWNDKMKMLDCKFLNGVKCCFDIPFGTFVARYHRIVVLRSKYDKEKQRMRIQTTLNDMLKKHNSHHTFIPDWIHDCVEWENDDILVEKVEQKNKQRMKKETFDFSEALRRMKEGKKVKRRIWNNGTTFINKKKIYVRCVSYNDIWGTDYLDVPFVGMPCIDGDILANDWEEVER